MTEMVPILNPDQYLKDVESTKHRWMQQLLGAYLSQHLFENHRCASEIFSVLINLKKRKGDFTDQEIRMLLEFNKKHKENPSMQEWKELAKNMGRRVKVLKGKLKSLQQETQHGSSMVKGRFSLQEDCDILGHVNKIIDINSERELKGITLQDFRSLSPQMKRKEELIRNRWHQTILPVLLKHTIGSTDEDWKVPFLKFIVDMKYVSITNVD